MIMIMKTITHSVEETKVLAQNFGKTLKPKSNQATVLALFGELGAGKTAFTQGLLAGFGVSQHVTSPTFVVEKIYPLSDGFGFKQVIHVDAYRLSTGHDLTILGFSELLAGADNLIIIEWPEKVSDILPANVKKIYFSHLPDGGREIRYDE